MLTEREEQIAEILLEKISKDRVIAVIHAVNTPERAEMMYQYLQNCKEITQDVVMEQVEYIVLSTTAPGETYLTEDVE